MKKIALILVPLLLIIGSCSKTINQKLIYRVTTYPDSTLNNIYIPDSGAYTLPIEVQFLSGNISDGVILSISGLPANVTVTPDSFSGKPSYIENFVFTSKNAARGTYPISITAYTPTTGTQTFKMNVTVIPNDCASLFWGTLSGSNACSARDYTFTATGANTYVTNSLTINNFGGYGSGVNVNVLFNGDHDSLSIPLANYGNGTILSGVGTFTSNTMIIYYTATSTPAGIPESCTDTLRLQ